MALWSTNEAVSFGYQTTKKNWLFVLKFYLITFFTLLLFVGLLSGLVFLSLKLLSIDVTTGNVEFYNLTTIQKIALVVLATIFLLILNFIKDLFVFRAHKISIRFLKLGASKIDPIFSQFSLSLRYFFTTILHNSILALCIAPVGIIGGLTGFALGECAAKKFVLPLFFVIAVLIYIYVSMRLMFYPFVLINKNATAADSLKRSYAMTKGENGILISKLIVTVFCIYILILAPSFIFPKTSVIGVLYSIFYLIAAQFLGFMLLFAITYVYGKCEKRPI